MQQIPQQPATASGTFTIGGDLTVYRLGFGAMRLTGPGIWGPPADKQEAIAALHRALELQRCAKRMSLFITVCFLQLEHSHSG